MDKHAQSIADDFFSLVAERLVPPDFISNVVVLSQGALWKHRMVRDPTQTKKASETPDIHSSMSPAVIEAKIFTHVLSLHQALLQVGLQELKEPLPVDAAENDLAQRITAIFRRTLPALRIASKWFRANFKYVMQDPEAAALKETDNSKVTDNQDQDQQHRQICSSSTATIQFWQVYADFSRALSRAFPVERLPALNAPLEEDVEMRGFLPLKKLMGEMKKSAASPGDVEVHPNVEQLMRISDLLEDARALVDMEVSLILMLIRGKNTHEIPPQNSPLALYGNRFVLKGVESVVQPLPIGRAGENSLPQQSSLFATIRDSSLIFRDSDEDAMTEQTSRTDDEVVRDAFKFLDGSDRDVDTDDQDDEIVWDPRYAS